MARVLVNTIKDTRKNFIINGDMTIAQRGTSFAAIANATYSLDRWKYLKVGAMVHTITQDTDVPTLAQAGRLFTNSLRMNLTTPDTSLAAGDYCLLVQYIEGYNWAQLAQKPVTISFWVKATLPGIYAMAFTNSGPDRSFVREYTINSANTWEFKTVVMDASPVSGTWNYTNGNGVSVVFSLAAGSTSQTAPNIWQTGNLFGTATQINGVNTGATDFRVTGVMVNEGSSAGSFRLFGEDITEELQACSRYYEKSYDQGANPGSATPLGAVQFLGRAVQSDQMFVKFQVVKRTAPIVTPYSTQTGTSGRAYNVNSTADTVWTAELQGHSGTGFQGLQAANNVIRFQWTADAEL